MRRIFAIVLVILGALESYSQIGYQVALLNTATGEPRSLETVSVSMTISDSVGNSIYQGTQSATTNEFGIVSLTIGNANTFDNVDWSKLPLYISATVDGILIGRTQILSVPIAEHAKHCGSLTKELLTSKVWNGYYYTNPNASKQILIFKENGDVIESYKDDPESYHYTYSIYNDKIFIKEKSWVMFYDGKGCLYLTDGFYYK